MGVVAVYSPKGGVGKTTLAVDLAWRTANAGHRTVLWDLDPQGGSAYLLGQDSRRPARAASLFHREFTARHLLGATGHENLALLQADDSLRELPLVLARLGRRNRVASVARDLLRDHDRVILDCPPHQNLVSEQIIAAADLIIVPLPPSPLSARALDMLYGDVRRIERNHPPILPVISMYDSRRAAHRHARETNMADWPVIPQSSQIEQTAFRRQPVGTFAARSDGAAALDRLWRGVEAKLDQLKRQRLAAA